MADLRLTVDISALTAAQAIVKKMDGKVLNLTFRTKGLNDINSIKKSLAGISGASKTSAQDVSRVAASFDNLGSSIKKSNTINSDGSTKSTAKYNAELGKTVTLTEKVSAAKKKSTSATVTQVDAEKLELKQLGQKEAKLRDLAKLETRYGKYTNASEVGNVRDALNALDPKSTNYAKQYEKVNQSYSKLKSSAQDAAYAQNQLTQANKKNLLSVENIKESMGTAAIRTVEWAATMGVLYGAVNAVRSMVSTSTAISDQMTSIKMVTGASDGEIKGMLTNYQNIATQLSSTTSSVAASAEVWLRQGRTIADTNKLIETSTVLSKVGFMDSATSAQMLTSAINGYKISAEDAMSVVDKMSAIDVAAATSTEGLAIAMSKTASGAKIAGVSMDELLSYVATIVDVSQAAPETVGNSLKTIFARVNNVKMGSLTDEEGGDISNVETVLKQYGITLRETNGIARDTGDIFDELGKKWSTLNSLQKSEIATQIAGVRQKEAFLVLMENYDKALNLQTVSMESAGSAMQKMSIWEESTEAATQRLSNQWEILSTNMVDSNFTKGIINLGTLSFTGLNSEIGQLIVKLTMLAAAFTGIQIASGKFNKAWAAADVIGGTGIIPNMKAVVTAQKEYKASLTTANAVQTAFAEGSFAASVAQKGLGASIKQTAAAVATSTAGALAIGVGAGLAVGMLFDAVTTSYDEHLENIENSQSKISENKNEIDSITTQLEESTKRIEELNSLQTSGKATTDNQTELEYLTLTNEQLQIKLTALKAVNEQETKSISENAIAALKMSTGVYKSYDESNTKKGIFQLPDVVDATTDMEMFKYQMGDIEELQTKYKDLAVAKSKGMDNQEFINQYKELDKQQSDLAEGAMASYSKIGELMKQITPGTSDEGDALLDEFKVMTDQWNKIGLLTGKIQSSVPTSAENAGQFNGASAQEFSDMGGFINTIEGGLASGLTELSSYKQALMTLFSDTNPPTDVVAALESLKVLFSEDEAYAGQFLETVNGFKTASGNFDLVKLQNDFNLSDTAIATVNSRLEQMGLLMSTSALDGVWNLGNGLGLASDDSTEFEMKLGNMLTSVKDGGMAFQEAEGYIRDYLATMGVTGGKIEQVVDDFSMLSTGASEFNLLAFTGLTGEGELADVSQKAESLASGYVTSFKDKFNAEITSGKKIEEIDLTSGFGVSADSLKEKISQELTSTGLFTTEQVSQLSETISNNTVNANFSIVAEGIITQMNVQDEGAQSKIKEIIQSHFNFETQTFDIPAITAEIQKINIEGVNSEQLATDIVPMLEGVEAEMMVTANTEAANSVTTELIKPEEKKVTVTADTFSAISQLAGVKTNIDALHDKTVTITTNVVTNEIVNKTVISSTGTGAGIGAKSATGRINIDTSQIGTQSLVGEEGEETLIRNGNVSFIGTAGAEIIPIRDGDTILPADITKRIKSGQIPMYADGKYSVSVSNSPANTDWYVNQRNNSSIWAGLAGDAPEDEEAKKAYEAHIKSFQKEYDYYTHLLDMGEMNEKDYYDKVNSLNDQYFKGKNEYLDEYRDHEKEVHDFLKKQEEERLKTLEENYTASSSYVLDLLDDQIDALKEQEELAEKQEKVDNLKNNKNQRAYYEGRGWVWEADKTAIAEAEKDVKDDSASSKLQEYRDKWAEIQDNYDNEQNKLEAIALLGDDFEKKVLDGDLAILRDFATKYSKVLGDVSNNEGDTSVPLLDYAKAWETDEIKRLMGDSSGGVLTTALSNSLMGGASTLSTLANSSSSNDTNINLYGDIKLENATDFDSFVSEATQYARVNARK